MADVDHCSICEPASCKCQQYCDAAIAREHKQDNAALGTPLSLMMPAICKVQFGLLAHYYTEVVTVSTQRNLAVCPIAVGISVTRVLLHSAKVVTKLLCIVLPYANSMLCNSIVNVCSTQHAPQHIPRDANRCNCCLCRVVCMPQVTAMTRWPQPSKTSTSTSSRMSELKLLLCHSEMV